MGFSLLEMVVVIVILGIIAVIASKMLSTGLNSYFTAQNISDASWQAQVALGRLGRDVRAISSNSTNNFPTASATQFNFLDYSGTSITYSLSGTTLQRGSPTSSDIAYNVNTLTFAYLDRNQSAIAVPVSTANKANIRYVSITLNTTQNGTNYNITQTYYLRNVVP
jgi:prepilin-type N-terminal cleavage/methylation domain-containing protein